MLTAEMRRKEKGAGDGDDVLSGGGHRSVERTAHAVPSGRREAGIEEIYRFPNGMTEKNGHKVWDVERLFAEILNGMKQCGRLGKIPHSMGIDNLGGGLCTFGWAGKTYRRCGSLPRRQDAGHG